MTALLEVEDLTVEYPGVRAVVDRAVNQLSFEIQRGEVVGLLGESGSGKSTAALACLGLTRGRGHIVSGSVRLDGEELMGLPPARWQEVRGGQMGLVTQSPRASLNPVLRVGEQIGNVYSVHMGATQEMAHERAIELLRLVGINDPARRIDAFPEELSGGMAQRVVIAMALSSSPKLLIADEPTSGLDVTVQAQILDDLLASVRAVGSGLLLVAQDMSIVANYCDRVYLLHAGEVAEHGPTTSFFEEPCHPATLALLAAQRRSHLEYFRLRGLPVDGRSLPLGCYLEPRCPFAESSAGCANIHPDLTAVVPGHEVRCHRAEAVSIAAREAWSGGRANAG